MKELKKLYKFEEAESKFVLDVQLEDYRDAYSDWDFSPFTNRDLDDDLTEYLLECSYEIPLKYELVIKFYILSREFNQAREDKSIIGMRNYFKYQLRKLRNRRIRVIRDMITFTVFGSVLLLAGAYFSDLFSDSLLLSVLAEGFYIGGWVMLWEMFSEWFFVMKKVRNNAKHFERLSNSRIMYTYE